MVKLDSNLSQINKNWQVLNQLVVKNVSLENNSEIEFAANLNTVNTNSDDLSEEVRELVATISDAFIKMSEDEQMVFIQFLIANADENITVELENNPDISSEELVNLQTTKETLQNLFTDFKNLYNELVKLTTDGNTPFVSVSADGSPELATASGSTASVSADVTQSGNYSSASPAEAANSSVPMSSSSEFSSATADAANFVSNTSTTSTSDAGVLSAKAADSNTSTAAEYTPASHTSLAANIAESDSANFVNNVTVENNVAVPEELSVANAQTTTPTEISPMLTSGSPLTFLPPATPSSPTTEATAPAPNSATATGGLPPLGASSGIGLLLFDNTINGLDFGTISGPTICYIVILMMMTGPLTRVMNNYSGQLTELGEEGDIVNDALNDFLTPIATWAAQNSSQITAAGGINLFDAFYVWIKQNNPSSPYVAGVSPNTSQIDEQFASSGSLSGVFELMYTAIGDLNNKLNGMFGTTGQVYLTVTEMVVNGDTAAYTSGTTLTPDNVADYGQQLLMTFLTEPANSAGYAINGITSNPIFSNSWTQAGNAQTGTWAPGGNPPFTPSSSSGSSLFYNVAAADATDPKYEFFLTLSGISQFIGNSNQNSGSSTNTGAISACLKSQTTVGTTNALLQGMLNLYSNTYSNYVSSLGNIIPALSIRG